MEVVVVVGGGWRWGWPEKATEKVNDRGVDPKNLRLFCQRLFTFSPLFLPLGRLGPSVFACLA